MSILVDRGIWANTSLTETAIKDFGSVGKGEKIELFVKMEDGLWVVGWDVMAPTSNRICRLGWG